MEIKKILLGASISALTTFAVSSMALADDYSSDSVKQHYSLGVNFGTTAIGIDATYKINNYFEPKIFGNYFQYSVGNQAQIDDMLLSLVGDNLPDTGFGRTELDSLHIPLDFKFVYENAGIAMDFHPFENGFYLSAGVAYNGTNASLKLDSKGLKATGTIGGVPINADGSNVNIDLSGLVPGLTKDINLKTDLGNARIDVTWNKVVPYFGMGFRGNFAEANLNDPTFLENLGFSIDMGSYYYGKPTVKVSAHSGVIDQDKINALNKEIKDQIDPYTKYAAFWPVVRFGLTYRF